MADNGSNPGDARKKRAEEERARRAAESAKAMKQAIDAPKATPKPNAGTGPAKKKSGGKRAAASRTPKPKRGTPKKSPNIIFSAATWDDFIQDYVDQDPNVKGIDSWSLNKDLANIIYSDPSSAEEIINNYDLTGMPERVQEHLFGSALNTRVDEETGTRKSSILTPEISLDALQDNESTGPVEIGDDFDPTDQDYEPGRLTPITDAAMGEAGGRLTARGGMGGAQFDWGQFLTAGAGRAQGRSVNRPVADRGPRDERQPVQRTGRLPSSDELDARIAAMGPVDDDYEVMYMDPNSPALRDANGGNRFGVVRVPETTKTGRLAKNKKKDKNVNPYKIKYEYHEMSPEEFTAVSSADPNAVVSMDKHTAERYEAARSGGAAPQRIPVKVPRNIPLTPDQITARVSPEVHGPGVRLYANQGLMPLSSARATARDENALRGMVGEFIFRAGLEQANRPTDEEGNFIGPAWLDENLSYTKMEDVKDDDGNVVKRQAVTHSIFEHPKPEPGEKHPAGISNKTYSLLADAQLSGLMGGSMSGGSLMRTASGGATKVGGARLGRPRGDVTTASTFTTSNPSHPRIPYGGVRNAARSVNNMKFRTDEEGNISLVHVDQEGVETPVTRVTKEGETVPAGSELSVQRVATNRPPADPRDVEVELRKPMRVDTPEIIKEERTGPYWELREDPANPLSPTPVIGRLVDDPSGSTTVDTMSPNYNPRYKRTGIEITDPVHLAFARDYQAFMMKKMLPNEKQSQGLKEAQTGIPRRNVPTADWTKPHTDMHPLSFLMADIRHPGGPDIKALSDKHGLSTEETVQVLRKMHTLTALVQEASRSPFSAYDDRLYEATGPAAASRRNTPSDYKAQILEVPKQVGRINKETGEVEKERVPVTGATADTIASIFKRINEALIANKKPPVEEGSAEQKRLWEMMNPASQGVLIKKEPEELQQQLEEERQSKVLGRIESNRESWLAAQPSADTRARIAQRNREALNLSQPQAFVQNAAFSTTKPVVGYEGVAMAGIEAQRSRMQAEREAALPDIEAASEVYRRLKRNYSGSRPSEVLEGIPRFVTSTPESKTESAGSSPNSQPARSNRRSLRTSDIQNTGYGMVAKRGVEAAINRRVSVPTSRDAEGNVLFGRDSSGNKLTEDRLTEDYLRNSLQGGPFSTENFDRNREILQRSYRADLGDLETRGRRQERDSVPPQPGTVKELPFGTVNLNPLPPARKETRTGPRNGGFYGRYKNAPALRRSSPVEETPAAEESPTQEPMTQEPMIQPGSRLAPRGGGFFQRVANRGQFNKE